MPKVKKVVQGSYPSPGVHKTSTSAAFDSFVHGTYWECASSIMASGTFSHSDSNSSLGERERHGDYVGVWMTDRLEDASKHYAWPTDVFGNKAFYGFFFVLNVYWEHLQGIWKNKSRMGF